MADSGSEQQANSVSDLPGFTVIIPARYASTRLPGKPLIDICGQTMIERVYRQATQSAARDVYVATDSEQIAAAVTAFGGKVLMTRDDHQSGSERLAECVEQLELAADDCVVNVQGDEVQVSPDDIDKAVLSHWKNSNYCTCIHAETRDPDDTSITKLALTENNRIMYISRRPITNVVHLGVYVFTPLALEDFLKLPETINQKKENIEMLKLVEARVVHSVPVTGGYAQLNTHGDYSRLLSQGVAGSSVDCDAGVGDK